MSKDGFRSNLQKNFSLIFGAMKKMPKNISTHSAELVVVNKAYLTNLEKFSMLIKLLKINVKDF